jgi:alpha-1,2-mannosyltransferase
MRVTFSSRGHGGLRAAVWRPLQRPDRISASRGATAALGIFGLLLLGGLFALYHLFDFHVFWEAGRAVLHGKSPYPAVQSIASDKKDYYVYPPILALVMAPFGALPFPVAGILFSVALVAAMYLTLRILGVRDAGCYVACLVWAATLQAIALGTVGPLLALLLALAWRYRDRRLVCAIAVAGAVSLKLFLWPLLVWLLATRRLTTGLLTIAMGAAGAVAAWAAIGFAGFTSYPHLLSRLTVVEEARAFSLAALNHSLGFPAIVGDGAMVLAGVGSLSAIIVLAARADGDRRAFAMAVAASLLLSPIVWLHYFCLLVVPIAITSKHLSRVWLVPAALLLPIPTSGGNTFVILWGLAVGATVFTILLRPPEAMKRSAGLNQPLLSAASRLPSSPWARPT